MTDSKYFTTTKKGEIFELKSELNNDKKEKKKEAVKKVYFYALLAELLKPAMSRSCTQNAENTDILFIL
jgi:hypothetical protein